MVSPDRSTRRSKGTHDAFDEVHDGGGGRKVVQRSYRQDCIAVMQAETG